MWISQLNGSVEHVGKCTTLMFGRGGCRECPRSILQVESIWAPVWEMWGSSSDTMIGVGLLLMSKLHAPQTSWGCQHLWCLVIPALPPEMRTQLQGHNSIKHAAQGYRWSLKNRKTFKKRFQILQCNVSTHSVHSFERGIQLGIIGIHVRSLMDYGSWCWIWEGCCLRPY